MKLERDAREFYDPGPVTVPTVAADTWEASFDGSTWVEPSDTVNDRPRWLVAGPEADLGQAVARIVLDTTQPRLRTNSPPELVVVDGPYIWLT